MNVNRKNSQICWIFCLVTITTLIGMLYKYTSTSTIRRIYIASRVLLVAIAVLYLLAIFIKNMVIYKDDFPIIVFVMYELIISKINGLLIFPDAIIDIVTWPCLYLVFKSYTRKRTLPSLTSKIMKISMLLMFFFSTLLIIKHRMGNGDAGGVVFYVYYCITYLPLVLFLIENRKIRNYYFIITIALLMLSTKRSGTITAIIGYVLYILSDVRVRDDIKNKIIKYKNYFLGFIILIGTFLILNHFFTFEVIERIKNISSDQGSGREYIWSFVLNDFFASDEKTKILGHGFQAVYYRLKPFGVDRLAHNSFLELLYDYGYAGLTLFIIFLGTIVKKAIAGYKMKDRNTPAMLYTLLICAIFGFTSYLFEESAIMVPIAIFWGCFDGEKYSNDRAVDYDIEEIN